MYGDYGVHNNVDLPPWTTEITGDLTIRAGDIPNLEALASLTRGWKA